MPPGISLSDFYYILPELVLTAGALLVLVADVLLPRAQRGALAWVTLRGARRDAGVARAVRRRRTSSVAHGLLAVDRFALFFKVVFLRRRGLTVLMSVRYLEIEGAQPGRVLLPHPLRDARHDDHGRRHRSHHHLHRPRDDGGVVLHPGRLHQAEPAVERGRGEVLPARRLLARHPALRHVAAVRPVGHDEPARRWRRSFAGQERDPRLRARGDPGRGRHRRSRSRRCRSTCGRRTCTKARRRRSRRSCRSARRRRRSRCCCGSSSRGCRR